MAKAGRDEPKPLIALYTDFGHDGPYLGQMRMVLEREAPGMSVVNLMADAPSFNPRAAAYLLSALRGDLTPGCVVLGVVDPGVGTSERRPVVLRADGRWFVGPDNGLFEIVARSAVDACWWEITWRPGAVSPTFHGRDLFAPVAAAIARGDSVPGEPIRPRHEVGDWPEDLAEIIYVDGFGNAMTGLRAQAVAREATVWVGGIGLHFAPTFGAPARRPGFWMENSIGLVEIACDRDHAASRLKLAVGTPVRVSPG